MSLENELAYERDIRELREENARLWAEVKRLEGLILDWDEMVWREDPLGSLFDEAKRIRGKER